MNISKKVIILCSSVLAGVFSTSASAGVIGLSSVGTIIESPNSLNTTPIADTLANPASTLNYAGGTINLEDYNGDALVTGTPTWWQVAAPSLVYTTSTAGIEITFDNLWISAFTFNIGAKYNSSRAWIQAYYSDGSNIKSSTFHSVNKNNSPAFGVYSTNAATSCVHITKIIVDPIGPWGIGNFGASQTGANSCGTVPEPNSIALIGLGFLALGMTKYMNSRRRRTLVTISKRNN